MWDVQNIKYETLFIMSAVNADLARRIVLDIPARRRCSESRLIGLVTVTLFPQCIEIMAALWLLLPIFSGIPTVRATCSVSNRFKIDCGYFGIDQTQCEAQGCCWQEIADNPDNYPWCYQQGGTSAGSFYYLSPMQLDSTNGRAFCTSHCNSDLASFHSAVDFELNAMNVLRNTSLLNPTDNAETWMGLNDIASNTGIL